MAEMDMRADERACKQCDEVFQFRRRTQVFCSQSCGRVFERLRERQRAKDRYGPEGRRWKDAPTLICVGCSNAFRPARSDRLKFCSRECAFEHRRRQSEHRFLQRRSCKQCGTSLAGVRRVTLCVACRELNDRLRMEKRYRPRLTIACRDCGTAVTGTKSKVVCEPCQRRAARLAFESKHGKVKKHRHRARRFGVQYEAINPIAVFQRDGWKCQVCGTATPKRLRGTNNDRAPELDHRIPMSRGGGHVWSNVQCCCRRCNIRKGADLVLGQANLFPIVA